MRWHLESPEGEDVLVEWAELKRLIASGAITPTTRLRRDGQDGWRPAAETELRAYLKAAGQPGVEAPTVHRAEAPAEPLFPRVVLDEGPKYRGDSQLVQFAYVLLGMVELIVVWLVWQNVRLIKLMVSGNAWEAQSAANEMHSLSKSTSLVGWIELALFVVAFLLFLRWLHRSGRNLLELGAEGLRFTPGWRVGCFFVPVLNLWLPYRAMEELWQASAHPIDWRERPAPGSIGLWWTVCVVASLSGQLAVFLARLADSPHALVFPAYAALVSSLIRPVAAYMTARLVDKITHLQAGGGDEPGLDADAVDRCDRHS